MEVCPEGLALVQDLALRIEECKGSALMIDYGNEGSRDTLRAFRKHQQVDMLSRPGTVDITADVDFGALRNAVNYDLSSTRKKSSQGDREIELTEAFGPQKQGQFLASMGAVERTLQLIEDDSTTDDQAEELYTALKRLLSEEDMGERFKVLAIAHKKDGIFPPAGF
jgi:NADH dehydrogenase [ubiquinone] 1 alpha subcomplex assembly factor 7